MTLPTDIIFPFRPEQINSKDPAQLAEYMRDLVYTLSRTYQDTAQAVNGDIRQFTPVVKGFTIEGVGTYTHQIGWYLRQGIIVDVWFDVKWTAHTGNGFIYVELPYKVKDSLQKPWVGVVQAGDFTFGAGRTYLVINAIPNTFRCEVFAQGTGLATLQNAVQATGHLIGHIRYVGQEFA